MTTKKRNILWTNDIDLDTHELSLSDADLLLGEREIAKSPTSNNITILTQQDTENTSWQAIVYRFVYSKMEGNSWHMSHPLDLLVSLKKFV